MHPAGVYDLPDESLFQVDVQNGVCKEIETAKVAVKISDVEHNVEQVVWYFMSETSMIELTGSDDFEISQGADNTTAKLVVKSVTSEKEGVYLCQFSFSKSQAINVSTIVDLIGSTSLIIIHKNL